MNAFTKPTASASLHPSVAEPAHPKMVTTAGETSLGRLAIDSNATAAPVPFKAMTSQSMTARPEAYSA